MMRRWLNTAGFALAGVLSVLAWSSIDAQFCAAYAQLCAPRVGECGGGVDTCATTTRTIAEFVLYVLVPPIVFAALGYFLSGRRISVPLAAMYIALAVLAHWLSTLIAMRIL